MSRRNQEKHDRRSYTGHYSNEAPSRHMPRPTVTGEHWENGYYYGMIRVYRCPDARSAMAPTR